MPWAIVAVLAASLLFVHYRFMRRDLSRVLMHWQEVEMALQRRIGALKALIESPLCPPEFIEAISRELHVLENREDRRLSRLKQRAALESRLSSLLQKQLNGGGLTQDTRRILEDVDSCIQTALRYYDIAANSYRYHFESVIGKLLSALPNFDRAPQIEIQKLHFN